VDQSDCSDYKKGRLCKYDFSYVACNLGGLEKRGCVSLQSFECMDDNKWQEMIADPTPCNIE
jgi:hypothetical protein